MNVLSNTFVGELLDWNEIFIEIYVLRRYCYLYRKRFLWLVILNYHICFKYLFQICNFIFRCNHGYRLIGSSKRTCLPISLWGGLPAYCKRKSIILNCSRGNKLKECSALSSGRTRKLIYWKTAVWRKF